MNSSNKIIIISIIVVIVGIGAFLIGNIVLKKDNVKLESKEESQIESADNHLYTTCSGTLTKNKGYGATCENSDNDMNITYKMYTGKYLSSYIVDDGIFIASYKSGTKENDNSIKNLEINFYDTNGDYKWKVTYDKEYNSLKPASGLVTSAIKVDDMYYIMLNVTYTNNEDIEHLLKYDLDGNLKDDVVIKRGYSSYTLFYMGKYNNEYYYNNETMLPSVAVITKDNYNLLFEDYYEEDLEDDNEDYVYPDYMVMNDKYLYGIERIYGEHEEDDDSGYDISDIVGTSIVKYDLDGNIIKTLYVKDDYEGAESIIATDNYLYLTYYSIDDGEYYVSKYNHDLELINKSIDYKKDINKKYEINNISGKDNKLYFEYVYNDDYIIEVTDENLKTINIYKSISEDALDQRYYLDNLGYIGDKFIQIFADSGYGFYGSYDEYIIVFNSKK